MSTPLRIATWNCAGALRKKLAMADSLAADVLVIQECEDPAHSTPAYRQWAGSYLWTGENKNRGLGVFAKRQHTLKLMRSRTRRATEHVCAHTGNQLRWHAQELQSFLPCTINDTYRLHAVWTKQQKPATFSYVGQLWKYVHSHRRALRKPHTIVCGDFNSNKIWDTKHSYWNHSSVVNALAKLGINSLYHRAEGEEHGEETRPTFYLYRHLNKPYHLDYVFLSEDLQDEASIELTGTDTWLKHSDHVPIVFILSTPIQDDTP